VLPPGSVVVMPEEPSTDACVAPEGSDIVIPGATQQPAESVDTGYTADGVPTFESVREKIETRYATSIGSVELAAETPEGRSLEEQYEARQEAAAERLAQIRASMSKDGQAR